MGRNEIRLRRKMMSSGRIAQYRNYGELVARHEREQKIRRMAKMFIYFLIIAFLLIIFMMIVRWEKKEMEKDVKEQQETSMVDRSLPGK